MFSTLMKSLEEGHHVFVDRYYTTAKLIDYLSSKKCHYTGTLNLNRKKKTLYNHNINCVIKWIK